ncbi:FunK1 9 [Puccinia graminis f. sp. tritici CRL 75-36-700-3]|uniref:FunK1 9 n=1 Tax=Puccinia graminis f. sp. tritici (strain CRL 75-36-700-3 / race SCCL) TaxID=418459 RepID=E3L3N4_PUCGT|nr:FunK1 9 [Puccinia graminis f. sp. tritici CRL 75-36-700-3]EFP91159.1 FunK1 9 [Puccinia graminis f. sp. tritici CRL 75-36-700-3]
MAQSSENPIEREQKYLYKSLHNQLTSLGINTVEQFSRLDESEKKQQIELLGEKIIGKITMSGLAGQLKQATSRITSLYHDGRFEAFEPLIAVILSDDAKSDSEMYEFIDTQFTTRSTHSSAMRTGTAAGLMSSSNKLSDILPVLKRELNDLMYTDVPGLVDHFIKLHTNSASLLKCHIDPAFLLQPLENVINQKFTERLTDTSEHFVLDWITPLLEKISSCLQSNISAPQHSRTWRSLRYKPIKGVDGQRKCDGAIMSKYSKDDNHIQDILVPVELKKNKSDGQEAALCLAKYVLEVFKKQPTRSYVIGFTLCGTWMQLWQFDRSGAIGSESFNIKSTEEEFKRFLNLITLFLTSNKQVLGFDPTFVDIDGQTCTPVPQKIQIRIQHELQEFVIDKLISRASGICGRGTTCWEAHLSGNQGEKFLIKDSWQPREQRSEGDMLRDLTARDVPNVVRYYHHEDVHVATQIVDIKSYVRGDINFESKSKIQIVKTPIAQQEQNHFTDRVLRRLILKDVGVPIWKVDSPLRLLEALEGCITGHLALLKAGYLHRDISINNLMINNKTTDPDRKSFVIDLDWATPYPTLNDRDLHARIGTKAFMSINLLMGEDSHTHVDDLESFFWVLTWICIQPAVNTNKQTLVTEWNHLPLQTLAVNKIGYLAKPHHLTDNFMPQYKKLKPLVQCVHNFAEIMADPFVREEKEPTRLYCKILELLHQAQEKLIETQQPSQSQA